MTFLHAMRSVWCGGAELPRLSIYFPTKRELMQTQHRKNPKKMQHTTDKKKAQLAHLHGIRGTPRLQICPHDLRISREGAPSVLGGHSQIHCWGSIGRDWHGTRDVAPKWNATGVRSLPKKHILPLFKIPTRTAQSRIQSHTQAHTLATRLTQQGIRTAHANREDRERPFYTAGSMYRNQTSIWCNTC